MIEDLPDNCDELIGDLRELVDAVRKDYRMREQAAEAPMSMLRAAAIIAEHPGMDSSSLARALRLERSTISNLLRDMLAGGLVRRKQLRSDRRFVCLELTVKGRNLLLRSGGGAGLVSRAALRLAPDEVTRLSLAIKPLLRALRADQRSSVDFRAGN